MDRLIIQGLSQVVASERLKAEGYNELPSAKRRSTLAIALEVVREPMFLLLVACGTIYLLVGDREEALMLLGFVAVVMGICIKSAKPSGRWRPCETCPVLARRSFATASRNALRAAKSFGVICSSCGKAIAWRPTRCCWTQPTFPWTNRC
jgi:hypothetical protein